MGGERGRRTASFAARLLFLLMLTCLSLVPVLLTPALRDWCFAELPDGAPAVTARPVATLLAAAGGGGAEPEPGAAPALAGGTAEGVVLPSIFGLLVKVTMTLGGICAVIYGMFWVIAKKGRARSGRYGLMRLVETMPLGQNRHVGIIEVAQRYFVVGIGDHSVNPIAELDAPEIAGLAKQDDAVPPPAFMDFLNGKVRQLRRRR